MTAVDVLSVVLGVLLAAGGLALVGNAGGVRDRVARVNATREHSARARTPGGARLVGLVLVAAGIALVVRGLTG